MNAPAMTKALRSHTPKLARREMLYVIVGITYDGIAVYTKGKIVRVAGRETFNVLISSKRSTTT